MKRTMTPRRLEANRRNAARSTGPRTDRGKAAVALNHLQHGLLAEGIIPGEAPELLAGLRADLAADLHPVGTLENALLDRVALCLWRLRRVHRVEAGVFTHEAIDLKKYRADPMAALAQLNLSLPPAQAAAQAAERDREREGTQADLGLTFIRGCNTAGGAFDKLARYEAAIERAFYRALHELERLQWLRAGEDIPAPVVGTVDLIPADQGPNGFEP